MRPRRHRRLLPGRDGGARLTAIYIDADACPVREEVYRVAARLAVPVFVVSNFSRPIRPPGLPNVKLVMAGDGFDAADDWIAGHIGAGDLCVTADIPLAGRVLAAGARAVAPNGHVWTAANIGGALAGRELSRHLRELGLDGRGPSAFTKADRSRFLGALDGEVRRALRDAPGEPPLAPAVPARGTGGNG
ncbi:MAG: YaiI/YqxD family protein [Thiohalocapsa sp.]